MRDSNLVMAGSFPPPVHGMSLINSKVREELLSKGLKPVIINLSPKSLRRDWLSRFGRLGNIIRGFMSFWKILLAGEGQSLYMGISGGYGQIYDALFVGTARLFRRRIFLHHHSYAYLNKLRLLTWILTEFAGRSAIHVVACQAMKNDLMRLYPAVKNVEVISGISVINNQEEDTSSERVELRTIGFLSNISEEKGIINFLDVALKLKTVRKKMKVLVAGPFQDDKIERLVRERLRVLGTAEYVGPKFGRDKAVFYNSIDALLFPTKYINESEGLVIHEAMSHGVPVIAWSRGCIGSIITPETGLVIDSQDDFTEAAVSKLLSWVSDPSMLARSSNAARERHLMLRSIHRRNLEALCERLITAE